MLSYRKLFASSFLATSVMTVFGYLYSFLSGKNLKEPNLLGKLVKRAIPKTSKRLASLSGWAVHYAVGLLFTEMYFQFWTRLPQESNMKSGFVFGAIGGLAAILIWRITFGIHPKPPSIHFTRFAINLFIGHILFGVVSALTSGCSVNKFSSS